MIHQYDDPIPARTDVLILGGGIHGVGILHDLASRGLHQIHLVERHRLAQGTSSRSTKLIHGGLRYLEHLRDFMLVRGALHERMTLHRVAPDLVHPLEFLFPILKSGGVPSWKLQIGLTLYDCLAGSYGIKWHRRVGMREAKSIVPMLNQDPIKDVFSFWDMQTDDAALVRRVGASAKKLGAGISEQMCATHIRPVADCFEIELRDANGRIHRVCTRVVINALGSWANTFLEQNGLVPTHHAVNSKGIHLLFEDVGLKCGLFLQSPEDGRIFFLLPWGGHTMVGTTESAFDGDPDCLSVTDEDIRYLLERCNRYLTVPLLAERMVSSFAGLRWLPHESDEPLGHISRADIVGRIDHGAASIFTIYGGKLTTYRRLSEHIGDQLAKKLGCKAGSNTKNPIYWAAPSAHDSFGTASDMKQRFSPGGLGFTPLAIPTSTLSAPTSESHFAHS